VPSATSRSSTATVSQQIKEQQVVVCCMVKIECRCGWSREWGCTAS
jgi:hypothetical protein